MIDQPGLSVRLESADQWRASGPLADRALELARRFVATLPPDAVEPHRIIVESTPPEHVGLGTGTQLGLAVAKTLAIAHGHSDWDAVELARRVGRGARSAVGVHGFQ